LRLAGLLGYVLMGVGAIATPAQAAPRIRWHRPVRVEPSRDGGVQAVSCPTSRLCVAVDASGDVLYTTRPTRGAHSWSRPERIDARNTLTGVSCPTKQLCVAVDDSGNVLSTTHPTRGAKSWSRPRRIDSVQGTDGADAGLLGISCPTVTLCVAVDGAAAGDVLSTTVPRGGPRAWRMVRLGGTLTSVSCPSAGLCVVAGSEHLYSSNPASGRSSWHFTGGPVGGGVISDVDCPDTTLCAGVGFGDASPGLAVSTASPRGGSRDWRTADVLASPPPASAELLDAVGCAGQTLCVALDTADNAYTTSTPVKGGWRWDGAIRPKSASQQNAISCTPKLCVVVDSAGVEVTGIVRG
jgi:hypothetical protein